MSGKFLARASTLSLALILAACGGGGDSTPLSGREGSQSDSSDPDSGSGEQVSRVATIQILTDSPQIGSSGEDNAQITALIKGSGGVALEGETVTFSADQNATLVVTEATTNASGLAMATLSAQGSQENRPITVTATSGNISTSAQVNVIGTNLSLSGPVTVPLNQPTIFTVKLVDSAGNPISNQPLAFNSAINNSVTPTTTTTDASGSATFTYTASSIGEDSLTVSAFSESNPLSSSVDVSISADTFSFQTPSKGAEISLNTPTAIKVRWAIDGTPVVDGSQIQFSATRGTFTPSNGIASTSGGTATIQISSDNAGISSIAATPLSDGPTVQTTVEFVAETPDAINLQASKTQIAPNESTEITATVRDENDNLVKNASINFSLSDNTGGRLSSPSGTTNSQGQAQVTYFSGSSTSSKDGVTVTASLPGNITDQIRLTVGGEALRINIGTGNEIQEASTTLYKQPWTAIVTDANGNAAANQQVELSVESVTYVTGVYDAPDTDAGQPEGAWNYEPSGSCPAEDINANGSLDAGEDQNNNGVLDPDSSASTPSVVTTDADGTANFDLTYLKSECTWVFVQLRAVTRVNGTESDASQQFILSCLAADLAYNSSNPVSPAPGTTSPYGADPACSTPAP